MVKSIGMWRILVFLWRKPFIGGQMTKLISPYLTEKGQIVGTVTFTVMFAVIYLNIYSPISTTTWFELNRSIYFFFTIGFITVSAGILVMSRVVMYKVRHIWKLTIPKYILWLVVDVFLITFFYTYVTFFLIDSEHLNFFEIFKKAIIVVSTIIFVPHTIAWVYGFLNDKNKILRLVNYKDIVSDEDVPKDMELIHLTDNNGNVKLSVKLDNLYYIESQDNYIKVFYISNNELKSYMLRSKLKTVEDSFAGSALIRCHRSYIINSKKISVIRKEKDGIFIDMDYEGIATIPVSKGYSEQIKKLIE